MRPTSVLAVHRGERGAVLLEALIALAVLAVAGATLIALLADVLRGAAFNVARERVLHDADRLLTASTLLTRRELDQRLGAHVVGPLIVDVQRPERTLYRIAVSEAAAPTSELLATVIFRPDSLR